MEQRWVFTIKSQDRAGVLTAATAVFSHRGVSLETIFGGGGTLVEVESGRFVLCFRATQRKQELLLRTLERLASVEQVAVHPYSSSQVRAIAIVRLAEAIEFERDGVQVDRIDSGSPERILLLSGSTSAIEQLIATFKSQNVLLDAAVSIVAV
ncbi:MAG: hypothetical protein ACFB4I_23895 [Cyanophyceae cyanobacterium]